MKKLEKWSKYFATPEEKALWLKYHPYYVEAPASFAEFCLSNEYLWLWEDVYDKIIEIWQAAFSRNYQEIVILAWIWSWKSFFWQVVATYIAHHILCMKDPHQYFWLTRDKPIEIINMGLTATQAQQVVFEGIKSLILNSPWFNKIIKQQWKLEIKKRELTFYRKLMRVWGIIEWKGAYYPIVRLFSWNSAETTPIGRNIFCGILDEASFYQTTDKRDQADEIYNTLKNRLASRFGKKGKIIIISSPRYEDDFTVRKYKQSKEYPEIIYWVQCPTWKFKDRSKFWDEVFVFDFKNYKILKEEDLKELWIEIWEYEKKYLEFKKRELNDLYWIVPMEYYNTFLLTPEKAVRDLWAYPIGNIEAFIKLRQYIYKAIWKAYNRVNKYWVWNVNNPPAQPVYIHIDLALNRWWKWDAAWIAVVRVKGYDNEWRPIITTEFVERVTAWAEWEIMISEFRKKIYMLKDAWWTIWRVTLDGFQSVDTIQQLKQRGIRAEYLSVDTTLEPYETLKSLLYEERLELPRFPEILKTELENLEIVNWKKVDHPPKWSKDVADAVCWAVYSCLKDVWFSDWSWVYLIK